MHHGNLQLLVGAVFLSALGDWLALTALALHLEESTGSGIAVSALFIALWAPLVVFAGPVGLLADRFDTRRVVVIASVAQAVVATALAFTGDLVPLLVLTALLGTANAVSQPAEFALIPTVVSEERLPIANAHVETARFAGFAAGPLLGGILVGVGGTRPALARERRQLPRHRRCSRAGASAGRQGDRDRRAARAGARRNRVLAP